MLQMVKGVVSRGVKTVAAAGAVVAAVGAQQAHAAGVDYTGLTSQIDWTTTIAAIMAIAGTLTLVYMAMKGSKMVLGMIKGR